MFKQDQGQGNLLNNQLHLSGQFMNSTLKKKKLPQQKNSSPPRPTSKESPKLRQSQDLKNSTHLTTSQEINSTKSSIKPKNGVYFSMNFKKQTLKPATNPLNTTSTTKSNKKEFQSNSTDQKRPLSISQEKPSPRSNSTAASFPKKSITSNSTTTTTTKTNFKKIEKENLHQQQPQSARGEVKPIKQNTRQQTPQTERKGPISKDIAKKPAQNNNSNTPQRKSVSAQKKIPGPSSKSKEREKEMFQRKNNAPSTISNNNSSNHTNNTFKTFKTQPNKQQVQEQKQQSSQQQQYQQQQQPSKQNVLSGLVTQTQRGQILPFQSPSKIPNSQKKVNPTPPKLDPKSQKVQSIIQIETNNNDPHLYIEVRNYLKSQTQSFIQPAFNNCIYYQTSLVHFHYPTVYRQQSPFNFKFNILQQTDQSNYFKELYEEHFNQNFYSIRYCKQFKQKPMNEISQKLVTLPETNKKRTIIFDLDETLIHCKDEQVTNADVVLTIEVPDSESTQAYIYVRPYCQQILQYLQKHFEILVFTASHQSYAERVLDYIDPKRQLFAHRFYREHCVQLEDGLFVKDLRILKNRRIENILLVDNAAYSFCFQLENGVPIIPFYDNKNDKELLYLAHYLMEINNQSNWVQKNGSTFKFDQYLSATSPEQCLYHLIEQLV